MGTCLATTKIIGTASLGILAGAVGHQAYGSLPLLTQLTKSQSSSSSSSSSSLTFADLQQAVRNLLKKSYYLILGLGSTATTLLSLAFVKAPPRARHPYLIYAALGAPLAAAVLFFNNSSPELKFLLDDAVIDIDDGSVNGDKAKSLSNASASTSPISSDKGKKSKKVYNKEEPSQLDNSVYRDLGADSEDDGVSSSSSAKSATPEEQQDIENEANKYITRTSSAKSLKKLKLGYTIASSIIGLAFGISTIGIYGDFS